MQFTIELRDENNKTVRTKEMNVERTLPSVIKWRSNFYILKGVNKRTNTADYRVAVPVDVED